MTPTPFGDQLKREREMRGVTLEEVSAATRIGTRFLEALEKEQWDQLPGGVFRRGFIRSVARYLGLDGDALISEYELQTKVIPKDHASANRLNDIPRDYRPVVAAVAFLLVLFLGGWFVFVHYGPAIAARLHKQRPPIAHNPVAPTGPPAAANPSLVDPSLPLDLKIQAGKSSEMKILADGKPVFDGHIDVDEVKTFEAHDTLEITASDPSALFLSLNGETLPPFGTPGEPGTITLTHNDLKPQSPPGGAH